MNPGQIIEHEPPEGGRLPPPKGAQPSTPGADPQSSTTAQQAVPLPIAHGTCKIPVRVLEKLAPTQGDPPPWVTGTCTSTGYIVSNVGNAYELITPGTSVGGPIGTGSDITDGGTSHWKFRQQLPFPIYMQSFLGALCEGQAQAGLNMYWDKEKIAAVNGTLFARAMELKLGVDAANQTLLGIFDSSGYQHTVVVQPTSGVAGIPSGTQKEIPDVSIELQTVMFGTSGNDVNPGDMVNDILTHPRRGVNWPSSRVDASITGTAAGGYRVYCDAAGLRYSNLMDMQKPALDWIGDHLAATNSEGIWSGGTLKIVPLGDQAIASPVFGATGYVPANTPVYDLTLDDLLDHAYPVQVF